MELSALPLQGYVVQHGFFQGALACRFWKSSLIIKNNDGEAEPAMGSFGRITKLSDLPPKKVLMGYIKEAMKLNDEGVKSPTRSKPKTPKAVIVPEDLKRLQANSHAQATFDKFSPSNQREYIEWLTEAKTEAHPRQAAGDGRRVDGRGEAAELEVHELLSRRGCRFTASRPATSRPRGPSPRVRA